MDNNYRRRLEHNLALRTVKVTNIVMLMLPFAACWYFCYAKVLDMPVYDNANWILLALFAVIYFTYGRIYDGFLVSLNKVSEMVYSQALAVLITDFIMYFVMLLLARGFLDLCPMALVYVAQLILSVLWSLLAHKWYFFCFAPKRSAIIYDMRRGMDDLIHEYGLSKKFSVEIIKSVEDCLENIDMLEGMEAVFLGGVHSSERNVILKYCIEHDIRVYVIPRVGDVIMSSAIKMHMFHLPMLRVNRYDPAPEYLFAKRVFDILSSLLALIVTSPVLLLTAIAIKAYDRGPVFYKQCRLTKDGKTFDILKFRSMKVDAEKNSGAVLSSGKNDSRITPVGRFIRAVRIDELPQFINILKGEMSIVGPRPERPEIAAEYEQELPEFHLRLQAKAGLTGYAQVYGKYNTSSYDKLQMDLMYIAAPSFAEDIKICFATVKILFMSESTEGVAEGQSNAGIGSKN